MNASEPTSGQSQQPLEEGGAEPVINVNTDLWGGLAMAGFGALGLALSGANFRVWIFPRVACVLLLLFGGGLVIKGFRSPDRRDVIKRYNATHVVGPFIAGLIAYYYLFPRLGFIVSTIVCYSLATWVLWRRFTLRSALLSVAMATVLTLALFQIFRQIFNVPVPVGSWLQAMGLS
jgi:Tripartite tricarboxylate transporter TctB family